MLLLADWPSGCLFIALALVIGAIVLIRRAVGACSNRLNRLFLLTLLAEDVRSSHAAVLDRMIRDGDREIARLQTLLRQVHRPNADRQGRRVPDIVLYPASNRAGTSWDDRAVLSDVENREAIARVCTLSSAGLRDEDVSRQTGMELSRVQSILRNRRREAA